MMQFVEKNLFAILMAIGAAAGTTFLIYMDNRHDMKGSAERVAIERDVSAIKREIREKAAYEQVDPDSKYSPARVMIIRELQDDLEEKQRQLKEEVE